jgi:hypothetical protein
MKGIATPNPLRGHGPPSAGLEPVAPQVAACDGGSNASWDVAMVATIVAVVLLGWLTAAGGNNARVPHPAHSAAHACLFAAVTPGTRARCTRR